MFSGQPKLMSATLTCHEFSTEKMDSNPANMLGLSGMDVKRYKTGCPSYIQAVRCKWKLYLSIVHINYYRHSNGAMSGF